MADPTPEGAPGASQSAFGMWKKTTTFLRDAGARTAESAKVATSNLNSTNFRSLGNTAAESMQKLGQQAAEGGTYVWNTTRSTTEGLVSRLVPRGLAVICQTESKEAPCPRLVLLCCTAICSGALASESLFTHDGPEEVVLHLHDQITASRAASLLPPGTTPQVITCVIKHWLRSLPEPLMTYKLVPALTSATTPEAALKNILAELPLVNSNTLHILLDTCHRIASNAAINDSDASTLAAGLASCLLWKPALAPPAKSQPSSPATEFEPTTPVSTVEGKDIPLDDEEMLVFMKLLTYLIANYRSFA